MVGLVCAVSCVWHENSGRVAAYWGRAAHGVALRMGSAHGILPRMRSRPVWDFAAHGILPRVGSRSAWDGAAHRMVPRTGWRRAWDLPRCVPRSLWPSPLNQLSTCNICSPRAGQCKPKYQFHVRSCLEASATTGCCTMKMQACPMLCLAIWELGTGIYSSTAGTWKAGL